MGAWGHGHFESDDALDFMADVEVSSNPKATLEDAFKTAIDLDYLEAFEANTVIVAATYVDRQVNGTRYSSAKAKEHLPVDTFPDRHPEVDLSSLKEMAIKALLRVLDENSELKELWEENEEDYPAWRQGIEGLIARLQ